MGPDEYGQAVADLAAFARAHRAMGHPPGMPTRECLTCPWIEQRRRELAQQCPTEWPVGGVAIRCSAGRGARAAKESDQ